MNWQSELINLGFLAVLLVAGYFKILSPAMTEQLVLGLVAVRLALLKPPGSGGDPPKGGVAGALGGSAVGAIILGVAAIVGARSHS
jgi:hypothetical protein